MSTTILKTDRLTLRTWSREDINPFATMCADPEVMRYFPTTLSIAETEQLVKRLQDAYLKDGFTYYAVTLTETQEFLGFCGLLLQTYQSPFTPNVDIGWRLKKGAWGKGYATEAAIACLALAKNERDIDTVISVASHSNLPSINVMRKIGMKKVGEFHHPALQIAQGLNPCDVYEINF